MMSTINISDDSLSGSELPIFDYLGSPTKESPPQARGMDISPGDTKTEKCVDLTQDDMDSDAVFDQIYPKKVEIVKKPVFSFSSGEGSSQTNSEWNKKRRKSPGHLEDRVTKKKTVEAEIITKKRKETEEKTVRKLNIELNKMYKPGECMKYMYVEMHPKLLEAWYCSDLLRELHAVGSNILPTLEMYDPGLVLWTRKTPQKKFNKDGQVEFTLKTETGDHALLVMTAEDLVPLVCSHQVSKHVSEIASIVNCRVTLVVFGVKDYFKPSRKPSDQVMSELDLEMAITDIMVSTECDATTINTANELALLIVQTTKAIGEKPFKIAKHTCDEQADFYMRGDNKKCVSIDKEGRGLSRLWQQMLATLPMSSLETARALKSKYPSPRVLYEALQLPDCVASIADVGVCRAAVPTARPRRIGPEFAKKLYTLFTADDGSILIE